jgi:hypothetical protein
MELRMSKRGVDFAEDWIGENINSGPYDPGDGIIKAHVVEMVEAAKAEGVTRAEIEEDMGDLGSLIADALESATDKEIADKVARDSD